MAKAPKKTATPKAVTFESFMPDNFISGDSEELNSEVTYWIDTGAYTLNLLISGSLFRGAPGNRNLVLAGEPSSGKTFIMFEIVQNFLKDNPEGAVFYFDTEQAVDSRLLNKLGENRNRFFLDETTASIEDFAVKVINLLNRYNDADPDARPKIMIILDSMGALGTTAGAASYDKGDPKADAGRRAKAWREAVFTIKGKQRLGRVPIHCTNHVYSVIGAHVPTKTMGGGGGPEYISDAIMFFSKRKINKSTDKPSGLAPGDGVFLTAKSEKQRFAKPHRETCLLLDFDNGLDRYFGLLDLCIDYGLVKKLAGGYHLFPDGRKVYEKEVNATPEAFFTKDFLDEIEREISPYFQFNGKRKEAYDPETGELPNE